MNRVQRPTLTPVAAWVMLCALLNMTGWILSAMGKLNFTGYCVVLTLAGAVTGWWWRSKSPQVCTGFRVRRFKRAFPLAFAVVAMLALAGGLLHAPNNYDALAYRTPRVLQWLAEGGWHWIHTDFQRVNTRGCGIEWMTAPMLVFSGSDRFFFLINAVSFLLLPGLCYSVLTGLGVQKKVAWHWMWVIPTGYCYLLQAGSIGNDLFGATLALAAVDFALRAARERSATLGWLAVLAAALMTACKAFNLLLLLPWGMALLPAISSMLRRPIATLLVGTVALVISLLPTALLDVHYCGDWKGLKAEPVKLSTGEPLLHLGVNGVLITLHNFNPTINPLAGVWNGWIVDQIPSTLASRINAQFEDGGAKFKLGEMQMEEAAGLGCGVSLLLLPVFVGRFRARRRTWIEWGSVLLGPAFLVPASTALVMIYFFTQSGLGCPARYLAPSYVFLLAPLLFLPRAGELLQRRWWRNLAMFGFALAALLLIATPARPLWPAQTVLRLLHAETSASPLLKRVWAVYSVYGDRANGFAPVRAMLPPDLKVLGLVTFDDPETSLWRPFGSLRIQHVTRADDAQALRSRGVEMVLVSEYLIAVNENSTIKQWLTRNDAEIVSSFELTLRASLGPTRWHLVRVRPNPEDAGRIVQ